MNSLKELMNMAGRRALITGATGHLGRVFADTLAEMGAELILVDQPGSDFRSLEFDLFKKWKTNCKSISCDLEKINDRMEMISFVKSENKGLSVLVNNAAFAGTTDLKGWVSPFLHQSLDSWQRAIEVNLTAPFHLCQAFLPELRSSNGGNIINIASIYGEFGPDWSLYKGTCMGNPAAYGVSKGGLIQFTRWLATTLGSQIRVNAISPGGIFRKQPEIFVKRYSERTPLGRMGTEDDFRGVIAYLASDLSKYVTGQVLHVDGGWGIW